jgi:hypothetical protein
MLQPRLKCSGSKTLQIYGDEVDELGADRNDEAEREDKRG